MSEPIYKMVNGEVIEITGDELTFYQIEIALFQEKERRTGYITKRQSEYPPITDYLDGIVKGDQAQVQAYIDACLAVKAKYPKGV